MRWTSTELRVKVGGLLVLERYSEIRKLLFEPGRLSTEQYEYCVRQLARELPLSGSAESLRRWALVEAARIEIASGRFDYAAFLISEANAIGEETHQVENLLLDARSKRAQRQLERRVPLMPQGSLITNARDAENCAKDWMVYWGYADAMLTREGFDGGIDVVSSRAIAQVKLHGKPIGAAPIQALAGIKAVENKDALFFSLTGYTPAAMSFADKAAIGAFSFDLQGKPTPQNYKARLVVHQSEFD